MGLSKGSFAGVGARAFTGHCVRGSSYSSARYAKRSFDTRSKAPPGLPSGVWVTVSRTRFWVTGLCDPTERVGGSADAPLRGIEATLRIENERRHAAPQSKIPEEPTDTHDEGPE